MSWLLINLVLLLVSLYWLRNLSGLWRRFQWNIALIQNYPGIRLLIHPHTLLGLLPRIPYINIGEQYSIRYGYSLFTSRGPSDVLSLVAFWPPVRAFLLADPVSIKHVTSDRNRYQKPSYMYRALAQYGPNVGTAEGDMWRAHRKIAMGSFSESSNQLAWEETQRTVEDCMSEWETSLSTKDAEGKTSVQVADINRLSLKIALQVVCATAFSHRPPWLDSLPDAIPEGHTMSLSNAVNGVLEGSMTHVMTPSWAYKLPIPKLHRVAASYKNFDSYMHEFLADRRASSSDLREGSDGRRDLLGALVYANTDVEEEDEKGEDAKKKVKVSDQDVLANMFVFLTAGHETTAHTVAFILMILALHQDEQDKLLKHINEVIPPGLEACYRDYANLTRIHAVFNETLRLYPSGVILPKISLQDSILPTSPAENGSPGETIFVPRFTEIFIDAVALHRNPRYWGEDCNEFKPDRFLDAADGSYRWPRDAFMAFSAGARSCIGQKFASVETASLLTFILRRYSVHLQEDLDGSAEKKFPGESKVDRLKRVVKGHAVVTLTPTSVPRRLPLSSGRTSRSSLALPSHHLNTMSFALAQTVSKNLGRRAFSSSPASLVKVAVLGAAGGIGQPLSLLLKQNPLVTELSLYDIRGCPGVAADVSHVNTPAKCVGYSPENNGLEKALSGAEIVVIPAGMPRKPGMSRDDLFNTNASIVRDLAKAAAKACPTARIAIIANPVNSTVPICAEVFKQAGVYDPKRLFGVTTLDVVRSSAFLSTLAGTLPAETVVPVVGGHSGVTIVPILSQTAEGKKIVEKGGEELAALVKRIQFGGDEVVKAKDGAGSATLSMAYAGAVFTDALLKAMRGDKDVVQCTYVESPLYADKGVTFFSSQVTLGPGGVEKIHPVGALAASEQALLDACLPDLASNIAKGVDFIHKSPVKA